MAFELKIYQERTLDSLERFFARARVEGPATAFATSVDKGLIPNYKPLRDLDAVPYACIRIPTGGGKTVMGAHIIKAAGRSYLDREFPLVLWLVPTSLIKTQTLEAFRDSRHPYRQELDNTFDGKVGVFDINDIDQIRPADIATKVCMVVATFATARVADTELRNVYAHKEALESHFAGAIKDWPGLERNKDTGEVLYSFANLLALHGPLIITDEAHNATTDLSYEVYKRLYPKLVVEMTATPDGASSNILVSVSALELKAEDMIKLPVVLKEHNEDWRVAIAAAVARRKALAAMATGEPEYIRPILLIQAESAAGVATVEEVRKHLVEVEKVPIDAIAIATGTQRELDGLDLFARDCKIEIVITKQALKEGWDCSFAYVFCSVAQVHSDKDVQQLLGRVLRMPYAKKRRQPAMNKAYAHVVSSSFGAAAAELTSALQKVGFNPFEARAVIQKEPEQQPLDLPEGQAAKQPSLPVTEIAVAAAPDLSAAPERDLTRVTFTPHADGKPGGIVQIVDEIDENTKSAVVAVVPLRQREEAKSAIEQHQQITVATKAPCQRGDVFSVPRLCAGKQGELDFVDAGETAAGFKFDLLSCPADLSQFKYDDTSMTFEVDIDETGVTYHASQEAPTALLPGFARDRTIIDLLGWLDQNIRSAKFTQAVVREWIRQVLESLTARGFSLGQLLQGQYILRRKLLEQLETARRKAAAEGFQAVLFAPDAEVVASMEPGYAFVYPGDMTAYPAKSYYSGSYRFQKHYYPFPGDLLWKTGAGVETEEFVCARALDMVEEVNLWVRNLVHPSQFWFPMAHARTFPDFVARLKDGRLFVIEYKGGDRFSNDDSKAKKAIGELWAARSGGKAVYLMAQKRDEAGLDVRGQMLAVIGK